MPIEQELLKTLLVGLMKSDIQEGNTRDNHTSYRIAFTDRGLSDNSQNHNETLAALEKLVSEFRENMRLADEKIILMINTLYTEAPTISLLSSNRENLLNLQEFLEEKCNSIEDIAQKENEADSQANQLAAELVIALNNASIQQNGTEHILSASVETIIEDPYIIEQAKDLLCEHYGLPEQQERIPCSVTKASGCLTIEFIGTKEQIQNLQNRHDREEGPTTKIVEVSAAIQANQQPKAAAPPGGGHKAVSSRHGKGEGDGGEILVVDNNAWGKGR